MIAPCEIRILLIEIGFQFSGELVVIRVLDNTLHILRVHGAKQRELLDNHFFEPYTTLPVSKAENGFTCRMV